ncbi:hypothetical protein KI387_018973 [Taxus chinensis]|uniref:Reverse transcriptase domain-containing protein n=1 Tax=Taxus chinensis TaxID=29808 RepID=A0AA38G9U1_TAXCH|nr:hypothetical protein KI387_018973 [Taxus chinensis]
MVLGVQWLHSLDEITQNYQTMDLKSISKGKAVVLCCMTNGAPMEVTTKRMERAFDKGQVSWAAECLVSSKDRVLGQQQYHKHIQPIIDKRAKVFNSLPHGLPLDRGFEHIIELESETKAVMTIPYCHPRAYKEEIKKAIKELLEMGNIRPSSSPFASSVVLVKKKDGTVQMCIDSRPKNDELIDELHGAIYFSKINLRSGYHQIRVRDEDGYKTAFRCHFGHFEFLVMPFGLTNAPATFQSCMNHVFSHHLRKFVLVFFDGILVDSKPWEEHLQHLDMNPKK